MKFFTNKLRFCALFAGIFLLISSGARAQGIVTTGHESAKSSANFTDLANYYLAHPWVYAIKQNENDDDDALPTRPPADLSLVHYRAPAVPGTHTPYIPTTFLPVSPTPTDTFESTLDNGSSFPPDTHGAIDSNYCVTAVNQDIRIQTKAGANVSKVSLDAFWTSVLPGGGSYDPRVHYDPYYHRWILITDANAEVASSSLLVAVSKTSNPTAGWWMYIVPIASPGNWLDYPDVGFNKKWVVVTGNLFAVSGGSYGGCKVFAFDYASLMSGAGAPFTAFTQSSSQCIAPTLTYDPTLENIFAVESWDGSAGGGGQMQLWKISGAVGSETMTSVGFPASSGFNWQSSGNSGSDFAPQLGTPNLIQTNDDRVFSCVYMNNKIWFSHNVFSPATGATTRCSAQWWQIDTFANPVQVGLIDDPTNANFYAFPSVAVNANNDAIVGFSQFSAATHPNAAYAVHMHTDPSDSMRPLVIFRHGGFTYDRSGGGRNRWGDYSGSNVDPVNMTDFWTIQETDDSATNQWDTWWAYIDMCNITATITPGGPTTFCAGGSVTLTATAGVGYTYQWQLGGSPVAGATNASYTALAGGSYTVVITSGCSATSPATVITVNPSPAAIGGTMSACVGSTTTLSDGTGGGTFSTGAPGIATVGPGLGVINGISAGVATISYTITSTGCYVTTPVSINPFPSAISGPPNVCAGATRSLSDGVPGGTWSSSVPAFGTVDPFSGLVAGISPGNTTITYTLGAGCSVSVIVTVNPIPNAISGTFSVCSGASTLLGDITLAGTWSSSNPAVATISGLGNVTGLGTGGLSTIAYTLSTGCASSVVVTVNSATPTPIAGLTSVCTGGTITLTDGTPGGTWSSTSPSIATVSTSGVVTGMATGAALISYSISNACGSGVATKIVTVTNTSSLTPSVSITPTSNPVCVGQTVTFTPAPVNGGSSPSYAWFVNGVSVYTGPTYSYIPSNGDVVTCKMTSNLPCISTTLATSAAVTLSVQSHLTNTLTVFVSQSTITAGSVDTFVAIAPYGGPTPAYQWLLNGVPIPGATNSIYITRALVDGQVISCGEASSLPCASPSSIISSGIKVKVISVGVEQVSYNGIDIRIIPNPNKGEFAIKGSLRYSSDKQVGIVITDVLGQTIYKGTANAIGGYINENIVLSSVVADGTYMVSITTGEDHLMYRMVVNR